MNMNKLLKIAVDGPPKPKQYVLKRAEHPQCDHCGLPMECGEDYLEEVNTKEKTCMGCTHYKTLQGEMFFLTGEKENEASREED